MLKDKHNIISYIETVIQSYGYEYQSISNEIKIYLDNSEVYIIINKSINIYEYNNQKPHVFSNLEEAIRKLKQIIS